MRGFNPLSGKSIQNVQDFFYHEAHEAHEGHEVIKIRGSIPGFTLRVLHELYGESLVPATLG